uniref:DBH-like monooxygenase protein 1 isoform X3 n=1 Tax=Ciona intestinalis TaxID=7719 RepID=UPI00089DC154|nr:DBH-like monooxygenase protein 1 isoform X3 [Ciona intestinalis]|eukprot:XP_018667095.1 DBH-like monooxygenase protein 1 isoform X3 [Ciona intestinalis]
MQKELHCFCFVLASIVVVVYGAPNTTEPYSHHSELDLHGQMKLYWNVNGSYITLELHGNTTGWIGMGFSPNGAMTGADMFVGWVASGTAYITDRHGVGNTFPPKDTEQNVELLSGFECDGWTVVKFKRQLAGCESGSDFTITADTIKVIYAYGNTDPTGSDIVGSNYHSTNRGARSLIFLNNGGASTQTITNALTYDMLNVQFPLPQKKTFYSCKVFQLPRLTKKHHIIKFEALVQKGHELNVHHIIVYACTGNITSVQRVGESVECYSANMPLDFYSCNSVVVGWAIGGGPFTLPDHVGIPLGEPDSPTHVLMEVHYDNPNLVTGLVDNSGIRMSYTDQLRQYDGEVMQVGHNVSPTSQIIPPNTSSYLQYGECTSGCLAQSMNDSSLSEIKLIGGMLHSHLLGRKLRLRHIYGNGTEGPFLLNDDNYDFNYQEMRVFTTEKHISSGDSMQMVCDYDSSDRSNFTVGGLSTRNEMCIAYILYYPKTALKRCETQPIAGNILNYFNLTNVRRTGFSWPWTRLSDFTDNLTNRNVLDIINSMHWNQTTGSMLSSAVQHMERRVFCRVNGSPHPRVCWQ